MRMNATTSFIMTMSIGLLGLAFFYEKPLAYTLHSMQPVAVMKKRTFHETPVVKITANYDDVVGFGSGVYIAPNKILTAAHVVHDQERHKDPETITVDDGHLHIVSVKNVTRYKSKYDGGGYDDLAIITMDTKHVYYPLAKTVQATQLTVLGYPSVDGKMKQGYETTGTIVTDEHNHLWVTDNYVESGGSGSGVLNERGEVVGIQVSKLYRTDLLKNRKEFSGSVKFTDDELKWINEHIQ